MALQDEFGQERNLRVMARWRSTARVLVEALPYILKYDQKTIVVKFGGNAMAGGGTAAGFRAGHRADEADRHRSRSSCMAAARRSAPC